MVDALEIITYDDGIDNCDGDTDTVEQPQGHIQKKVKGRSTPLYRLLFFLHYCPVRFFPSFFLFSVSPIITSCLLSKCSGLGLSNFFWTRLSQLMSFPAVSPQMTLVVWSLVIQSNVWKKYLRLRTTSIPAFLCFWFPTTDVFSWKHVWTLLDHHCESFHVKAA